MWDAQANSFIAMHKSCKIRLNPICDFFNGFSFSIPWHKNNIFIKAKLFFTCTILQSSSLWPVN